MSWNQDEYYAMRQQQQQEWWNNYETQKAQEYARQQQEQQRQLQEQQQSWQRQQEQLNNQQSWQQQQQSWPQQQSYTYPGSSSNHLQEQQPSWQRQREQPNNQPVYYQQPQLGRQQSRTYSRSSSNRTWTVLTLAVIAGSLYASYHAPVDRTVQNLYHTHQPTIDPIINSVQHQWQQIQSRFTHHPANAKPWPINSLASQFPSEEQARKQALNAAIAQVGIDRTTFFATVDKLFYARHPELAGRSLTTYSSDANLRQEWDELAKQQLQLQQ